MKNSRQTDFSDTVNSQSLTNFRRDQYKIVGYHLSFPKLTGYVVKLYICRTNALSEGLAESSIVYVLQLTEKYWIVLKRVKKQIINYVLLPSAKAENVYNMRIIPSDYDFTPQPFIAVWFFVFTTVVLLGVQMGSYHFGCVCLFWSLSL